MPFRVNLPPLREQPGLLVRSPMVWALVALSVLFLFVSWIIEREAFIVTTQALRLVFSLAVFLAYLPAAYVVCLQKYPQRWGYLTLGICGSWGAEALFGLRSVFYRLAGRPEAWQNSLDIPFLVIMSGMFAIMHLTAGAIKEGDTAVPRAQWIYVAVASAIGVSLGVGLLILARDKGWATIQGTLL